MIKRMCLSDIAESFLKKKTSVNCTPKDVSILKLNMERGSMNRMLANIIVVIIGISFFFALQNLDKITGFVDVLMTILRPFVYGFAIAFLLNNPVKFFDKTMKKVVKSNGLRRALSVFLVMVLVAVIIGILTAFLVPQLVDSAVTLINNIQYFLINLDHNMDVWLNMLTQDYNVDPELYESIKITWDDLLTKGSTLLIAGFQYLLGFTGQVTTGLINVFVAIIISIYLLMSRERFFAQVKKVLYAMLQKESVEKVLKVGHLINITFNGFIIGKIIDSLIIGIIAFICLSLMKMPYVLLVSVIIGVTNVIPFFGPFIGAIPSAFIIFIVDPVQALWFVLFIIILQQFDGNILGPKILGGTTGLPAIWVMFAILVGGGLAGFVGMILGVPTVAVCYMLFREYITKRLEGKHLPCKTIDYENNTEDPYQKKEEVEVKDERKNNGTDPQSADTDCGDGAGN